MGAGWGVRDHIRFTEREHLLGGVDSIVGDHARVTTLEVGLMVGRGWGVRRLWGIFSATWGHGGDGVGASWGRAGLRGAHPQFFKADLGVAGVGV